MNLRCLKDGSLGSLLYRITGLGGHQNYVGDSTNRLFEGFSKLLNPAVPFPFSSDNGPTR